MANPLSLTSSNLFFVLFFAITLLYIAHTIPKLNHQKHKETNLVIYVHDCFTGHDKTAVTVAGQAGPNSNILQFGTLAVVDDPVTVGSTADSGLVGRAQGMYVNSDLNGESVYMVFSVIFTEGEFKGSSLEIQGADPIKMKQREFGVVSGTGYFRFVKGYGIMETHFMDLPNLRAVIKLNITVKHY